MRIETTIETWKLKEVFTTARHRLTEITTIHVKIQDSGVEGNGEAVGVDIMGENANSLAAQINGLDLHRLSRENLREMLGPGGARNALDCAFWDLECKLNGDSIWQLLDMKPRPITTVYTIPISSADAMAAKAEQAKNYPILKVKLNAEDPVGKMQAIRKVRPDAHLVVDCNQGWDMDLLRDAAPALRKINVEMIEQPLKAGEDYDLIGYHSPVPLCADESCNTRADISYLQPRYQMINIKLDKAGGLTEALAMIKTAKREGLKLMVGNMLGTSLGMAPAFVIAQSCKYADLDGPLLQREDREHPLVYHDAKIEIPSSKLWG